MTMPQRILVVRNDKLGDFMLSWPALAALRRALPKAQIALLVPAYTEPLARICPYADQVLVDPKIPGAWRSGVTLAQLLKPHRFDAVITLFSRFDTGLAVWLAGIPRRYAPATKLAQVFYNRRVRQRRSRSEKPEYVYNLELVEYFLNDAGCPAGVAPAPPYLQFPADEVQELKNKLAGKEAAGLKLVMVHAGHGGSASNLSAAQYAELIRRLASKARCHFVLTAGPGEEPQALALSASIPGIRHSVYASNEGLMAFAKHLQCADVFVSGSTGPLHVAAALDRRTAAFYPRRRSANPLRWQTMNAAEHRLAFAPPETAGESEMAAIDVTEAAGVIAEKFLAS